MKTVRLTGIISLILAVIAVSSGCVKENECSRLSDEYFPNRVGNWWSYSRFDSLSMQATTLNVEIVRDSTGTDGRAYKMWVFSKSNIYDTLFVRTTADTVFFCRYPEGFPTEVMLIPLKTGLRWTHPFFIRDSVFVTGKDNMTIKYEQYTDVFILRHRLFAFNDYMTDTRWFIPHLGIAQLENWHYLFGWISKENWLLKDYRVNDK